MTNKKSTSSLISDLKRKTRKKYSSEEKIRIIIHAYYQKHQNVTMVHRVAY